MSDSGLKIIVVESGADAAAALRKECSESHSHDHHVFCRGPDEALHGFGARVLPRIRTLRRTVPIRRVSYIMGRLPLQQKRHDASESDLDTSRRARAQLLRELTKLLPRGSNLAIVATPDSDLNLIEIVDPLLSLAPLGSTVKASLSRVDPPTDDAYYAREHKSGTYERVSALCSSEYDPAQLASA